MKDQRKIEGGCLCGSVRYTSSKPPMGGGYCHCSMCRKAYGHLYAALLQFSHEDFKIIKGKLTYYQESTLAKRSFCQHCGSSISFSYDGQPTLFVLAGTLDKPDDWPIDDSAGSWGHTFVADKVAWLEIKDGLPQHAQTVGFLDAAQDAHDESNR